MYKKSRFKSFILSFIPGLGHIYSGFAARGIIFLGSIFAIIFLLQFIQSPGYGDGFLSGGRTLHSYKQILEFILPFIWLSSIIDNFILTGKLNKMLTSEGQDSLSVETFFNGSMENENRKLISVLLNVVPGAGHIYLGLKDKGIQLMGAFFLIYLLAQFIGFDILNLLAALVWIYSVLDAISKNNTRSAAYNVTEISKGDFDNAIFKFKNKLHWFGGLLIFLGAAILLNRLASSFIDRQILREFEGYIKDGIISLALVGLGIKMLAGNKNKLTQVEETK